MTNLEAYRESIKKLSWQKAEAERKVGELYFMTVVFDEKHCELAKAVQELEDIMNEIAEEKLALSVEEHYEYLSQNGIEY